MKRFEVALNAEILDSLPNLAGKAPVSSKGYYESFSAGEPVTLFLTTITQLGWWLLHHKHHIIFIILIFFDSTEYAYILRNTIKLMQHKQAGCKTKHQRNHKQTYMWQQALQQSHCSSLYCNKSNLTWMSPMMAVCYSQEELSILLSYENLGFK